VSQKASKRACVRVCVCVYVISFTNTDPAEGGIMVYVRNIYFIYTYPYIPKTRGIASTCRWRCTNSVSPLQGALYCTLYGHLVEHISKITLFHLNTKRVEAKVHMDNCGIPEFLLTRKMSEITSKQHWYH
jgi:hypothetical protein